MNGDGDLDLIIADRGGTRLLRNDGGNAHLSMQVRLVGLRTGSGKNNDFGIGAKVEVPPPICIRRVVTSPVTHFGLRPHLKADVVRIEWPNGVPRTVFFPGTDQDVIENEILKGSCAFVYTWDGTRFRFVTDVMWRSALGMPLGLLAGGAATAYAPAGRRASTCGYRGAHQPRNGKYASAHGGTLGNRLRGSSSCSRSIIPIRWTCSSTNALCPWSGAASTLPRRAPRPPLSAVDDRGNDVLAALRDKDDHTCRT